MTLAEIIAAEMDALRARTGRTELTYVETGTIRVDGAAHQVDDGWSTVEAARQIAAHGGTAISIDLETGVAATVLERLGMDAHVRLVQGHSLDALSALCLAGVRADVILLDSDNDPDLIMAEFVLARRVVATPGTILIDDVDPGSGTARKGDRVLPWMETVGARYEICRRTGLHYSTGVLILRS